jgi:acetyl esterase/lipase
MVLKKKLAEDRGAFDRASPMSRVRSDAPPFFIVHGDADSLVPVAAARHFAQLLRASSKQPVCYAELPQAQHAFETFHSLRTRNTALGVDRFLANAYVAWLARDSSRNVA